MNANILEIFKSIQGEGAYAGANQIFVRFYECNMFCVWCDTPHSIGGPAKHKLPNATPQYTEMTMSDVVQEIEGLWDHCHSVSLTGGEPLVQADFIKELLPQLAQRKFPVHLETNGILFEELVKVIDGIDVVSMDFKLPSSTGDREYWTEHEAFLKIAREKETFIKVVVTNDTEEADILKAAVLVESIDPDMLFIIQPNFFEMKDNVVAKCIALEQHVSHYLSNVRVIPQMHKMLKVR